MKRICSIFILFSLLIWLYSCGEDPEIGIGPITFGIPEIARGPYLGDVTETSIVVSWATTNSNDSVVEYATDDQYIALGNSYDQKTEGLTNARVHNVTLTGLQSSTLYHYRVVSGSETSEDNTFHTAVDASEPFTIVAYGDSRTLIHDHQAVVDSIMEHEPRLILDTGDLVSDGRILPLWDVFFFITRDLISDVPYYPVLGNHEQNSQFYYDLFHLPKGGGKEDEQWYSFDYGNTHFVCLDSNDRDSSEQLAWLENDLAQAAGKAQWIVVNSHHAFFSSGQHGSYNDEMSDWIDAFEQYGVDIVFNGHDHIYERSSNNGIWYIVAGGGGAPLRPVDENPNPQQVYAETSLHFCKMRISDTEINYEMIREDGTVGDSMTITK